MTTPLAIVCVAFLASVILTPLVRAMAKTLDFVDRPDGQRKVHRQPTPLGGGVAVLLATVIAVVATLTVPNPWHRSLLGSARELVGLLLAAVVLCAVGLADDRKALRGRQKLLGQVVAAGILMMSGFFIRNLRIFDWQFELGPLAVVFTMFWLLGAINALNLLDGIDGLATTVGVILSLTVGIMALICGHPAQAAVALSIAGSLLGFLCFNFPPASIFLGDAGSMVIGLAVGAMAIRSSLKGPATVALAAPLAVWAIPIFDSAAAILRRKLTGRSIYATDRAHLHHCLLSRGYTGRQTLAWIAGFCGVTAAGALASVYLRHELLAALSILAVVSTLVVTRIFGYGELLLLANRLKATGISLVRPAGQTNGAVHQATIRLQGSSRWEPLWSGLLESAERLNLNSIRLIVNLPDLQEDYHGSWERPHDSEPGDMWQTEIPLIARNRMVGRLEIAGAHGNHSVSVRLSMLEELLDFIEQQIATVMTLRFEAESLSARSVAVTIGSP